MSPRILVVEPYADLRTEITAVLRRAHYSCDAVATPADAVLQLRLHDYAYVVVDLDSADTGPLLSTIGEGDAHVILLADDTSNNVRHGLNALQKPFGRDELIARLV